MIRMGYCDICLRRPARTIELSGLSYALVCAACPLPEPARDDGATPASVSLLRTETESALTMDRNDLFPSRYLKAVDLGGKPLIVTIKDAKVEALNNPQGGGTSDKLVLSFVNQSKRLVCNITNYNSIADVHGDETDGWTGKRIELYPTKASVGGKSFDAVRVRQPMAEELNDAIPV